MATIQIHNLAPAGSHFFSDSESYLENLSDDELSLNRGGIAFTASSYFCIGAVAYGVSYVWGRWGRR